MYTDQEIIEGIRQRDNAILNAVYQKFRPRIVSHIGGMGGSNQEGEDIFQEALIALFIRLQSNDFQLTSAFYTFLYSICHNKWLNRFRQKNRHEGVRLESPEVLRLKDIAIDTLEYTDRIRFLMSRFEALGDGCKNLLQLSIIEEKSPEEIVEILGFGSVSYYYKRKSNCKDKLLELDRNNTLFDELQ